MKLWLDDVRRPGCFDGSDGWTWAKTADEAIALLKTGEVVEASLDHDLAVEHYEPAMYAGVEAYDEYRPTFREKTGYDVVLWMAENNVWPEKVVVHSFNPAGRKSMEQLIARHKP